MAEPEAFYECEVKKQFTTDVKGEYEWRWTTKRVVDVIGNKDVKIRCKECHGEVKLHGRNVAHGPAPHAEHRRRQDSENCRAGIYFRKASKADTEHRKSLNPVL